MTVAVVADGGGGDGGDDDVYFLLQFYGHTYCIATGQKRGSESDCNYNNCVIIQFYAMQYDTIRYDTLYLRAQKSSRIASLVCGTKQ